MSYTIEVEDKVYTVEISSIAIANTYSRGEVDALIAVKADTSTVSSHTADTTIHFTQASLQPIFDTKENTFTKNTAFNKNFGTSAGEVCQGNDARLSDARTPISHTHGNVTNDGKIGSTTNQVVTTTTNGVLTTSSRSGIDSRSTFPPDSHTLASHSDVGGFSDTNPLMNGSVSQGTSDKLSRQDHIHPVDTSRAAVSHTHVETDLSLSDNTDNNASTTKHGFLAKLNASTSNYMRGDGTWATPTNTTYSEITEAEIDAGTASTARAISGRRSKYMLDKVRAEVSNVTVSSSAPSSAPTKIGNIYIDTTTNRFYIAIGTGSVSDWRGVLIQ